MRRPWGQEAQVLDQAMKASGADLAIEQRPLDSLIPYARNARTHSEDQVALIAGSIREFGWTTPILRERRPKLEGRLLHAKEEVDKLEADLLENDLASERTFRFQEVIGGELQCPRRWVFDGKRSSLRPIPSQTKNGTFCCPHCEYELDVRG